MDNFRKDEQVENKSSNNTIFTKETFGMLMVLFAVLCMVCLITKDAVLGQVGSNIAGFLLGVLGYFSYPYFVLFAYFGITLVVGKAIPFSKKSSTYLSLVFVLVALLVHGVTSARFDADTINFANISFGKYLTYCYDAGKNVATAGGVIAGLIAYWGMRLFTYGGFYAIAGVLTIITIIAFVNYLRKGNTLLERGKVDVVKQPDTVDATAQAQQPVAPAVDPTVARYPNDPFYGVTDAPISQEVKFKNSLFITDGAEFNYLSKKEMPVNIKLNQVDGGLYLAGIVEPKKLTPQEDLNAKLNYIKTPRTINVEETLNRINNEPKQTTGQTNVSSTVIRGEGKRIITEDYVPQEYQGFDDPIPTIDDDKPINTILPEDKPIGYNATTTDRAIDFNNRYIDTPEIDETELTTQTKDDGISELFGGNDRPIGSFSLINEIREKEAKKLEDARKAEEEARMEELRKAEEDARLQQEALRQEAEKLERERLAFEEEKRLEAERQAELIRQAEEEKRIKEEQLQQQIKEQEEERISSINDVYFAGPEPTDEFIPTDKPEKSRVIGFASSKTTTVSNTAQTTPKAPSFSAVQDVTVAEEVEPVQEKKPEPINRPYYVPSFDILEDHKKPANTGIIENHEENLHKIEEKLSHFKIPVEGKNYIQGPSFTRYEFSVSPDVSIRNVLKYDYDLMATLEVQDGVRILAPIPGKNLIGVEVANKVKTMVSLKEVLVETEGKKRKKGSLMFSIGKNLIGEAIEDNLAKGPHYLVAGSTGSGKSVCLNSMLISLIMRYSPEDMKLILIDPKTVEFAPYEHLPHLVTDEIISDLKKVLAVLDWAIEEMERRYATFRSCEESVVDIDGYNDTKAVVSGKIQRMPRIVIVIDELADLMSQIKRDIEGKIQR